MRIYLERAIADEGWLLRRDGVPLPAVTDDRYVPDAELLQRGYEALSALSKAAQEPKDDAARFAALAVRLVDFMTRAGMLDLNADPRGTDQVAHRLIQMAVDPVALDPVHGPAFVAAAEPVDTPVRTQLVAHVVRDLVSYSSLPAGQRVPPPVLGWLFPQPPQAPSPESLLDPNYGLDPLVGEIAAQATSVVPDPSGFRLAAIWAELSAPQPSPQRLGQLATGPGLAARELVAAAERFGTRVILAFLLPTLVSVPEDRYLAALVLDYVLAPQHGLVKDADYELAVARVVAAARLRSLAVSWWESRVDERHSGLAASLVEEADRLLTFDPYTQLAPGLDDSLVAAHVVDVVCRPVPRSPRKQLDWRIAAGAANGSVSPDVPTLLWHALENRAITDRDLVLAALHGGPEPLPGPRGSERTQALRALTTPGEDGRPEPVLKEVVRLRLRRRRFPVVEVRDSVQEQIHRDIREAVPDRHLAKRWISDHDAFAERWWASVVGGTAAPRWP